MAKRSVKRAGNPRRSYHSPERERRASKTRERIVAAASSLFLKHGYFPTSIRAIATAAGVAEQTVYLGFKTKAALLDAVIDAAIGGGDPPAAFAIQRQEVIASPPGEIVTRFAEMSAGVMERTARVLAMAEAAATIDPELARFRERAHAAMRAVFGQVATALHAQGVLATGISEQQAAGTIYALTNDSVYLRLADGYGWSAQEYGRWLGHVLTAALTP